MSIPSRTCIYHPDGLFPPALWSLLDDGCIHLSSAHWTQRRSFLPCPLPVTLRINSVTCRALPLQLPSSNTLSSFRGAEESRPISSAGHGHPTCPGALSLAPRHVYVAEIPEHAGVTVPPSPLAVLPSTFLITPPAPCQYAPHPPTHPWDPSWPLGEVRTPPSLLPLRFLKSP